MIYRKLPVVLLSMLSSEPEGSTNAVIAEHLLAHRDEVARMSVRDLAGACAVGAGSISRFCRDVGLSGFQELREALAEDGDRFAVIEGDDPVGAWADAVPACVARAARSVGRAKLAELAGQIHACRRVSAFGMLKAEAAALDLQADLLLLGRRVRTAVGYADQLGHILSAPDNELVLVFSYTGDYFSYRALSREELRRLGRLNLWMVAPTGSQVPGFVSDVLAFESSGSQFAHPFELQAVASLIAQEYARQRGGTA